MNVLDQRIVHARKIKPLYDFLREDIKITDLFFDKGTRLVKIFDASDEEIIAFAHELPNIIRLNQSQLSILAEKIKIAES